MQIYPDLPSPLFAEHSSAIAICWTTARPGQAFEVAAEELRKNGLVVDQALEVEETTLRNARSPNERNLYRLAQREGVACSVDLRRRLSVDRSGTVWEADISKPLMHLLVEFCEKVRARGSIIARYSAVDGEWATARLLEQDTLPLWSNHEDAQEWAADWPEHYVAKEVQVLSEFEVLLLDASANFEPVALCLHNALVTFNPAALRELVSEPSRPRWPIDRGLGQMPGLDR